MPQSDHEPKPAEAGEQVPARPHDSGSAANETVDGLDATTEALWHAAEDTPSGTGPGDVEKTPVFDRAAKRQKSESGDGKKATRSNRRNTERSSPSAAYR